MKRKATGGDRRPTKKANLGRAPSVVLGDVIMGGMGGGRRKANVALAPEKKFFDSVTVTDASTTASVLNLNNMGAGDTAVLRDGNKIICQSVQLRGSFENESLAQNNTIRYMVVHDKNSNGTAPTAAQVFEGTPAVQGMKSISNASRFTTLLDKVVVLNNLSDTAGAFAQAYISEYIKVPQALQLSAFADGTAAVPVSGSLSLIIIGSTASGATDVNVVMNTRLRFIG
jgi:hypothetical protein